MSYTVLYYLCKSWARFSVVDRLRYRQGYLSPDASAPHEARLARGRSLAPRRIPVGSGHNLHFEAL